MKKMMILAMTAVCALGAWAVTEDYGLCIRSTQATEFLI